LGEASTCHAKAAAQKAADEARVDAEEDPYPNDQAVCKMMRPADFKKCLAVRQRQCPDRCTEGAALKEAPAAEPERPVSEPMEPELFEPAPVPAQKCSASLCSCNDCDYHCVPDYENCDYMTGIEALLTWHKEQCSADVESPCAAALKKQQEKDAAPPVVDEFPNDQAVCKMYSNGDLKKCTALKRRQCPDRCAKYDKSVKKNRKRICPAKQCGCNDCDHQCVLDMQKCNYASGLSGLVEWQRDQCSVSPCEDKLTQSETPDEAVEKEEDNYPNDQKVCKMMTRNDFKHCNAMRKRQCPDRCAEGAGEEPGAADASEEEPVPEDPSSFPEDQATCKMYQPKDFRKCNKIQQRQCPGRCAKYGKSVPKRRKLPGMPVTTTATIPAGTTTTHHVEASSYGGVFDLPIITTTATIPAETTTTHHDEGLLEQLQDVVSFAVHAVVDAISTVSTGVSHLFGW